MEQGLVFYLSCFLLVVFSSVDKANAAYECYACSYSDMADGDPEYCADPDDDETTTANDCTVGCYAMDAVLKYDDNGVENTTRLVLRGCADPAFDVGGCLRGQQLLNHYKAYVQPFIGPDATGIEKGSICSCKKNICNGGVPVQPISFLIAVVSLCGFFMTRA